MSTRVQKGATVFKPVAKARSRGPPESLRRVSSTPDPQGSASSDARAQTTPAPDTSSMPPPSLIPDKSGAARTSRAETSDSSVPPASALSGAGDRGTSLPPSVQVASSRPTTIIPVPPSTQLPSSASYQTPASSPSRQARTTSTPIVSPSRLSRGPPAVSSSASHVASSTSTPSSSSVPIPVSNVSPSSPSEAFSSSSVQGPRTLVDAIMTAAPSSDVSSEALTTQQNFVPIDFSALIQQVAQAASNAPSGSSDDVHGVPEAGQIGRPSRRKSSTAVVDEAQSVDVAHARPKRTRSKKSTHATQEVGDDAGESEPAQRKRRIRRATTDNGQREDGVPAPARKRRRTTTDSPRKRRGSRSSSAPVFDPDADPGEDLDPTVVTMATLCDDTGQGRVSSKAAQILDNHAAWKRSSRERRERMRAKMESKKYGRNDDDEDTTANNAMSSVAAPLTTENSAGASASETPGPSAPVLDVHDEVDEPAGEGSGFDYSQSLATSRFNVQVRIGPNGETIVDEESLFVDRAEEQDTANYTHVEESDATKFVNSASYGKKFRGTRWSAEETDLFFDALSQFGENYELISYVLPGRDRKACKSKFKIEDKRNPNRITHCLNNRVPYDIQTLSRMTGKDFSGPTPIIRARTPPTLSQDNRETSETSRITVRKQSRTPGLSETGDEIGTSERGDDALGHQQHQDIDPTLSNGVVETAASETNSASGSKQVVPPVSRGKPAARKKGKGKQDDGVEVLGAIDGDWD